MSTPDPTLGVLFHAIGGLASASFYLPFRGVKRWSWETYWLVGGVFSWIVAPWVFAGIQTPDLIHVLTNAPAHAVLWTYLFGVLWGIGGLTFGLTMRYLGIALGMAMALGYCAAFGTLMPPLFRGELGDIARTNAGMTVLFGVFVCLLGIVVSGMAGRSKERELTNEQKHETIREFNFGKGVLVATISGILSACMSYGFAAGKPIAELAVSRGSNPLWQNLPVLVVVLAGGFTTNALWCLFLNVRNRTAGEYVGKSSDGDSIPASRLGRNALLSALAGTIWYLQFLFYGMGNTLMGPFEFSSWTLHMATIMIFGTLWGLALHEWRGTSVRTRLLNAAGLAILVLSTVIVGYGNAMGTRTEIREDVVAISSTDQTSNTLMIAIPRFDSGEEILRVKPITVEKALEMLRSNETSDQLKGIAMVRKLGPVGLPAVPLLLELQEEVDEKVMTRAFHCVTSLGPSAVPLIVAYIRDPSHTYESRLEAVYNLIQVDDQIVSRLLELLHDPDPNVRLVAIQGAGAIPLYSPELANALRERWKSNDPWKDWILTSMITLISRLDRDAAAASEEFAILEAELNSKVRERRHEGVQVAEFLGPNLILVIPTLKRMAEKDADVAQLYRVIQSNYELIHNKPFDLE